MDNVLKETTAPRPPPPPVLQCPVGFPHYRYENKANLRLKMLCITPLSLTTAPSPLSNAPARPALFEDTQSVCFVVDIGSLPSISVGGTGQAYREVGTHPPGRAGGNVDGDRGLTRSVYDGCCLFTAL